MPSTSTVRIRNRALLLVVGLIAATLLGYGLWVQAARVPFGTYIGDTTLSALRWDQAGSQITALKRIRDERRLTLALEDRTCATTPQAMGLTLDPSATLRRLREQSRQRGFWSRLLGYKTALMPELQVDRTALSRFVEDCEGKVLSDRPFVGRIYAKEGSKEGTLLVEPSRAGRRIDAARLVDVVRRAYVQLDDASLALPVVAVEAKPSPDAIQRALAKATTLLSKPIVLSAAADGKRLTLLKSELAKLLDWQLVDSGELELGLSRPAFEHWLSSRRHRVEQPARNATYSVDAHNHFTLVPEAAGSNIAVDALFERLLRAVRAGERAVEIPFEPTSEPKLRVADIEHLNIHELVGSFTTRHACCQSRVQNIHRIADLVNGTIVLPGATLSLNELVGPRTLDRGFVAAPSIQDGDMLDAIGGGVSQFATTFYNAAMRSGYEILERQAHSYWFDRYPMGHEATLSWPKPDLVIRNDTASGLLILTSYDERSITVKFYGDREGRRVSWAVSPRFDIVLPKTEYLPNPEIEPDDEKVKEGGCIGWSVNTSRTVTLSDGTRREDKRKIVYKPRIRRVEVHPCKVPAGEPGATGEKCPKPKEPAETGENAP
jgi:vancomycin resistance protein YoaR